MATNTIVLIIVTAIAALVLAGMIAGVAYKTRTIQRPVNGETFRDQADEDAQRLRRQQALADEYAARAHAAQVEIDIKTIRACRLQQQATVHRSEAAASREQPERADGQRGQVRYGCEDTRNAPARWTFDTTELTDKVVFGSGLFSVGVGAREPATPFAAPLSDHPIG